jgi:hypothetical protein
MCRMARWALPTATAAPPQRGLVAPGSCFVAKSLPAFVPIHRDFGGVGTSQSSIGGRDA